MALDPRPAQRAAAVMGALALGVSLLGVAVSPAGNAAPVRATLQSAPGVSARTVPGTTALAVIRTIALGADGLGVATGGHRTPATSDDTIYVASNDQKLNVIDPVTLDTVATVNVGVYPIGVAVHPDDTVYVVNANDSTMTVIAGRTLTVDNTIGVPNEPQAVAVSRVSDDTLFITSRGSSHAITSLNARTLSGAVSTSVGLTNPTPFGLGLTSDDTAFIAAWPSPPRKFDSTTRVVTNLALDGFGADYIGVAVSADDTVYMTNEGANSVTSFKATTPGTRTTIPMASSPQGIAIGHDGTVYVANRTAGKVTAIDPVTSQVDDSVSAGVGPYGIAVTRTGLVVTTNNFEQRAQIIAGLTPALTTTTAFAGDAGSLTIGGLPTGVTVDDSTVTSIAFGDDTVAWARTPGTNTYTGLVPPGSGSVDVVVSFKGGNSAYAGAFTYAVPPPPPVPADPPTGAEAVAGDASAMVTWTAPASSGSYAVTAYQAIASPGGRSCLTSTLTCSVSRLTNGVSYTFTVKALTGAGWSVASASSAAVTPERAPTPTITITGTRTSGRAIVSGTTTGFGMGVMLTPWFRVSGTGPYREGTATLLVATDGTFTWTRRLRSGRILTAYITGDGVRSNTVRVP